MTVYTEDFNTSNGPIASAATDLAWIDGTSSYAVVDNGIAKTAGDGFNCCHVDVNVTPHHFAKFQMFTQYGYHGVAVGISDATHFYHNRTDGAYQSIVRKNGGSEATILTSGYLYAWVANSYVRLERIGNSLAIFSEHNTYPLASALDSTLYGERAGFANYYSGVGAIGDNFSCGDLPAADLADGLLHYLKLNEASGSVTDVINSKVWTESGGAVSRGTGIQGLAPSFTYGGNYLTSAPIVDLMSGFTISCWVKATTTPGGYYGPWGQTDSGWSNGVGAYWSGSSMLWFIGGYGGANVNGPSVTATAWNHFVATWDGAYLVCYTNGTVSGAAAHIGPLNVSSNFLIGTLGSGTYTTESLIDEFAIYTRALSHGEVAELYGFGTPPDLTPAATGNRRRRLLLAG